MGKLIILRGNSGSGKTTVAKELQKKFGYNTMLISQDEIEKYLNSVNKNLLEDLCKQSMVVLKDKLARKYEGNSSRKTFSEDNLWKEPYDVLAEYPVILKNHGRMSVKNAGKNMGWCASAKTDGS